MNRADLIKVVHGIARPLGYRRKGALFWKADGELATLIHLQGSRWGKGVYVNFGVIPTGMITKPAPPSTGYWPIEQRAEIFDSPFREQFVGLVTDDEGITPAETMTDAFRWLFTWVEENLADTNNVRRAILEQDPNSGVARMGPIPVEWVMYDWARGALKEPSQYYKNLPYYR